LEISVFGVKINRCETKTKTLDWKWFRAWVWGSETETETKASCKRQMMGYVWRHYVIKSNNNLYFVKFLVAIDCQLSSPRQKMQISSVFIFVFLWLFVAFVAYCFWLRCFCVLLRDNFELVDGFWLWIRSVSIVCVLPLRLIKRKCETFLSWFPLHGKTFNSANVDFEMLKLTVNAWEVWDYSQLHVKSFLGLRRLNYEKRKRAKLGKFRSKATTT